MFETANNDQQFLVIDMIVDFSENHAFAVEDHRVKYILIIILRQYFIFYIVWCIDFQNSLTFEIEMTKNWSETDLFLQISESLNADFVLNKRRVFSSQLSERFD